MDASNKHKLQIAVQRFDDPVLRATVEFRLVLGSSEPSRMRIVFWDGDESREYRFDASGEKTGSGVFVSESTKPDRKIRLVK